MLAASASLLAAEPARIVLLAGLASHGRGEHAHPPTCFLLQSCLQNVSGVSATVHLNGWPADPAAAFAGAATIVLYSDGGGGNPFLHGDRLRTIGELMDKGVGLVCLHYAVEPSKEKGQKEFLDWIGGCYEQHWSVNPSWDADFKVLPAHPITRGVTPFRLHDEWYFHMRFRSGMQGITPILSAVAPPGTMNRPDGPHEGNPAARESVKKGEPQHLAWAYQRPDGGRGFGFTGGHFYKNWGNLNFRTIVLNAILWTAKVDVPAKGVVCTVTEQELKKFLEAQY